ncbi:MAG: hypothetical protein ACYDCL_23760 [Myxococcales bacterium]
MGFEVDLGLRASFPSVALPLVALIAGGCRVAPKALLPGGATCASNHDCASGFCSWTQDFDRLACAPLPAGSICRLDEDCLSNICVCSGDQDNAGCVETDGVPGAPNGLCGPLDGGGCGRDDDCASHDCAPSSIPDSGSTCGPRPNNASCARNQDCSSGVCFRNGVCGEGLGGPCSSTSAPCGDAGQCPAGLLCFAGECLNLVAPLAGPDCQQQWALDGGAIIFLQCYQGTCEGLQPDGGPCTWDLQCASALCVDGTCGEKPDGDACTSDVDCQSGWCDATTAACRATEADGTACGSNDACASSLCFDGKCQEFVGNGGACTADAECHSGICTGNICTCLGPSSEVTSPSSCCSNLGCEYDECTDPLGGTSCSDPWGAPVCCACTQETSGCCSVGGDGNFRCITSAGMACEVTAQCDPGQTCGASGVCCGLPWGVACGCGVADAGCSSGTDCCSGSCNAGGRCL